jgi:hypothetical protein
MIVFQHLPVACAFQAIPIAAGMLTQRIESSGSAGETLRAIGDNGARLSVRTQLDGVGQAIVRATIVSTILFVSRNFDHGVCFPGAVAFAHCPLRAEPIILHASLMIWRAVQVDNNLVADIVIWAVWLLVHRR